MMSSKVFYPLLLSLCFATLLPLCRAEDPDSLQGTWVATSADLGGQVFPDEIRRSIKLVIRDGKYSVNVGAAVDEGTITWKPTAKPKELDIVGTAGPSKGKTILAIYEQSGDVLRICYDLGGKARPTEFKAKGNPQLFLVEYRRAKS